MNFAPGGWKYALPPLLAAPFALLYSVGIALVAIGIGVGTLAFFRDPDRTPPPTGVVAPCDGNVSVLREEDGRVRLGIFMNVWHVHVIRAPFDATVTDVEHVSGANRPAFSKESDRNERVHVRVLTEDEEFDGNGPGDAVEADNRVGVPDDAGDVPPNSATITLIAGAFARRIHPYVEDGEELDRGQRIGHIAFGSRVDVLFPPSVAVDDVAVDVGDSMTAGETVVLETDTALPFTVETTSFETDTSTGADAESQSEPIDGSDDADAAS